MLDLQQFCSTDELRAWLTKPFRAGDHSYASNGQIMVRVPAREQDEPPKNPPKDWEQKVTRYFLPMQDVVFSKSPPVNLPALEKEEVITCSECEGRGTQHDCPDCECTCGTCKGTTQERIRPLISADFAGAQFDLMYLHQIMSLPALQVAIGSADVDQLLPLLFRFEGGEGSLMPLRGKYENHVDIAAHGTPPAHG